MEEFKNALKEILSSERRGLC